MGLFSSGKTKGSALGLIDLGSGSVSLAVLDPDRRIIFSATKTFAARAADSLDIFLTEAATGISAVLAEIPTGLNPKPECYSIVLPAPLFVAVSKTLSQTSDETFPFNQSKLQSLLSQSATEYLQQEAPLFSALAPDSNVLIENKLMSLALNGYPVAAASRQNIKTYRAKQYLSLGSKKALTRLTDAVSATTQVNQVEFQTFPLVAYLTLDNLLQDNPNDYLILDVGGELTDLVAVHNRHFSTHFSFPYGLNFLLKKIAGESKTSLSEAGATLRLYYEGKLESAARDRLTDLLLAERKLWLDYFLQALKKIGEQTFIFPHIYLLGDDYANFFFREFLRDDAIQVLVINRGPLHLSTAESLLNLLPEELKMNQSASPLLRLVAASLAVKSK